jgi:toxin ParE1/3/4
MKPLAIEILPDAAVEAHAAQEWYLARSSEAAAAFLTELDAGIGRIQTAPDIYPPHRHGTRCYLMRRFPYLIVYRTMPASILVVAIAHSRRKPGYWKARVSK